jgi:hypothetical protein
MIALHFLSKASANDFQGYDTEGNDSTFSDGYAYNSFWKHLDNRALPYCVAGRAT